MTSQVPANFSLSSRGKSKVSFAKDKSSRFRNASNLAERTLAAAPNVWPGNGIVLNEPFVKNLRVLFWAPRERGILDVLPPTSQ